MSIILFRLFAGLTTAALSVVAVLLPLAAQADTIAIIGTGRVASALGPQFAKQGHTIIYGSRDPSSEEARSLVAETAGGASVTGQSEAAQRADMVVIAVPGGVAVDVVRSLGDLSGKIILDPTNITTTADDGFRVHAVATSNAELIQAAAPGSRVVKAFNTLNYQTMIDPAGAGGPVTIPIAGDDTEAKRKVAQLAERMGFEAMDLGPLRYAHTLEELLVIWVNARQLGTPFDYHFRRQR